MTLEVVGRRTGRVTRFPLGMADWEGDWYLVSMLGNDCDWVRNVRAAGGLVTIRHGRARSAHLVEVPVAGAGPHPQAVPAEGTRGQASHPGRSQRTPR